MRTSGVNEGDSEAWGDQGNFGWALGGPGGVATDEEGTRMRVGAKKGDGGSGSFEARDGRGWPEAEGDQGARWRVMVPASP